VTSGLREIKSRWIQPSDCEITPSVISKFPESLNELVLEKMVRVKQVYISAGDLTVRTMHNQWQVPWEEGEGIPRPYRPIFESLQKHSVAFMREILSKGEFETSPTSIFTDDESHLFHVFDRKEHLSKAQIRTNMLLWFQYKSTRSIPPSGWEEKNQEVIDRLSGRKKET